MGVAQAFLRRKLGPESVAILAVAANLPDIDGLVHLSADPAAITLRRSFGHSVFAMPLWSLAAAWLWRRRCPQYRLSTLFGMNLLGCCVHVLFDLVNSFGVLALWPFDGYRPELSIIFIIDLALTGLLALPFLACRLPPWRGRLEALCRASLACVAAYVLLCAASRTRAEMLLQGQDPGRKAAFSYVFPEPLGPHRWRGVIRFGERYQVYLIHSFSGRAELKREVSTADSDPRVLAARDTKLGRRLQAFFKAPVWRVEEEAGEVRVKAYDLRFRPLVVDRGSLFEFVFSSAPYGALGGVTPRGWAGR